VSAPATERIAEAVHRYLDLVANGTAAQIAECYAPDGTLSDPEGSEPSRGRGAIEAFYKPLEAIGRETELLTLRVSGGAAAFHFRVRSILPDQVVEIEPIDVMTFDDDGLITSMRAFWSQADMRVR